MGRKNREKILRIYFENPGKKFTVRELASGSSVPRSSVQVLLNELGSEGMIDKDRVPEDSIYFSVRKTNYFIEEIVRSGLIDYLVSELSPSVIILFGSFRKGDSNAGSDIDLFVESYVDKSLDLSKYERRLKHKVDLFVEKDLGKINKTLFNNIINGVKLYGSFSVK